MFVININFPKTVHFKGTYNQQILICVLHNLFKSSKHSSILCINAALIILKYRACFKMTLLTRNCISAMCVMYKLRKWWTSTLIRDSLCKKEIASTALFWSFLSAVNSFFIWIFFSCLFKLLDLENFLKLQWKLSKDVFQVI